MPAALLTNPPTLESAIAISSRQSPYPDQGSAALHPKVHQAMQQMLKVVEAIGYCQGIRQRASQADKLQKLMFHRQGMNPLSGSDLAARPPCASQPQQQQPDEDASAHHQAVAQISTLLLNPSLPSRSQAAALPCRRHHSKLTVTSRKRYLARQNI